MRVSHTYRISFHGPLAGSILILVESRAADLKWWNKNKTKDSRLRSKEKGRPLINLSLISIRREKWSIVYPTRPYFRVGWHHLTRSALSRERKREKQRKRVWETETTDQGSERKWTQKWDICRKIDISALCPNPNSSDILWANLEDNLSKPSASNLLKNFR